MLQINGLVSKGIPRMKMNDCLKQYQDGVQKAIAPQQAYKYIKDRLKSMEVPIVDELETFTHPSGISQCRIVGSSYYKSITSALSNNNFRIKRL